MAKRITVNERAKSEYEWAKTWKEHYEHSAKFAKDFKGYFERECGFNYDNKGIHGVTYEMMFWCDRWLDRERSAKICLEAYNRCRATMLKHMGLDDIEQVA